jgi:hypothetical protein
MGRWIRIIVIILLLVAGAYWFLERKGIESCQQQGRAWDYARQACANS